MGTWTLKVRVLEEKLGDVEGAKDGARLLGHLGMETTEGTLVAPGSSCSELVACSGFQPEYRSEVASGFEVSDVVCDSQQLQSILWLVGPNEGWTWDSRIRLMIRAPPYLKVLI